MHSIVLWIITTELPQLIGYVILGTCLMVADRYIGVPTYRWYYNRSTSEGHMMPEGAMGWLYNQPLRRQHNRALALSVIFTVFTIFVWSFTIWEKVGEGFGLLFEGWAMLPGFWFGNIIYEKVLLRQEQIFHALDNRQEIATGIFGRITKALGGLGGLMKDRQASAPTMPPANSAPPTPERSMSAREILQRKADGRKI